MIRRTLIFTAVSLSLSGVFSVFPVQAELLTPVQPLAPVTSGASPETARSEGAEASDAPSDRPPAPVVSNPEEDIAKVRSAGLMGGYPDGDFHAEGTLTRAQLASILVKTFRLNERPAKQSLEALKDVPSGYWASADIQTVITRGVMEGYHRNGFFHPEQRVNRAEALAIVAQAYGVQQLEADTVRTILSYYPDAEQVPAWAQKAMVTSLKNGFVDLDSNGKIRPLQPMTRGDMAFALSRYLDRLHETEQKTVK